MDRPNEPTYLQKGLMVFVLLALLMLFCGGVFKIMGTFG